MDDRSRLTKAAVAAALGAVGIKMVSRRRGVDPVHAEGHRHRPPPPAVPRPEDASTPSGHDQPWVRTSHSDSQQRRFRR